MKKAFSILAALAFAGAASAQQITPDSVPAPHYYCEIMANHLPTHRDNGVLFDFGQRTGAWKYNYLTNEDGDRLLFASGIEALNFMVGLGWEFVQVYTSGEDNQITHYLLRIAPDRLGKTRRKALNTPREREKPKKENPK